MLQLNDLRLEISFNSFEELRLILLFYDKYNLKKVNIPCKNNLKKEFLIRAIRISREEFPHIDIIPHFSIQHEFNRNKINTINSFKFFLRDVKTLGCKEVLLVSGSQKKKTLDSVSILNQKNCIPLLSNHEIQLGVAFNPYLSKGLYVNEIHRLQKKVHSGCVNSIWIQFGTDINLLSKRIRFIKNYLDTNYYNKSGISKISFYGSILIPSKQFISRFKFRPWKGVYCSTEFLDSVDKGNYFIIKLLSFYQQNNITPIIETKTSNTKELSILNKILNQII
tara:strand:- start:1118 stop:1957 length:840 start_codon:yes stop_codon:yes gene_type:complete